MSYVVIVYEYQTSTYHTSMYVFNTTSVEYVSYVGRDKHAQSCDDILEEGHSERLLKMRLEKGKNAS